MENNMVVTVTIKDVNYNKIVKTVQKKLKENNENMADMINPMLDVLNKNISDELKGKIIIECIKKSNKGLCDFISKLIYDNGIALNISDIDISRPEN